MAYRGIDLRDFYRRGSGLTPRRLLHLIQWLPADDPVHYLIRQDAAEESKPTADKIRSRQREWQERNNRAKEAADG